MSDWFWVLWSVLAAVLIVAEMFTSGFVLLWFGIGALFAAFAGLIGIDSLLVQFMIFVVVSIGLTAAGRGGGASLRRRGRAWGAPEPTDRRAARRA